MDLSKVHCVLLSHLQCKRIHTGLHPGGIFHAPPTLLIYSLPRIGRILGSRPPVMLCIHPGKCQRPTRRSHHVGPLGMWDIRCSLPPKGEKVPQTFYPGWWPLTHEAVEGHLLRRFRIIRCCKTLGPLWRSALRSWNLYIRHVDKVTQP